MENRYTIVTVLRHGGDFTFKDVELIARHINGKWRSKIRPRIICLWDKASTHYDLGNIELMPLPTTLPGTWSRIHLYSPEMDQYRPFLYVDLDTVVVSSIEQVLSKIADPSLFITLEDFWQKGQLATGLVWFPKDSDKVKKIWSEFRGAQGKRMDRYIREVIGQPDIYWQNLTKAIYDFKPRTGLHLKKLPQDADLVCFHGKPRIFQATDIEWVNNYINEPFPCREPLASRATVIIPYNKDRGWLQNAIDSVPKGVQLLLSKGDGNWPENFNKVLDQAEGDYIRWLHEDDMLTPNCLEDSIQAIEEQGVDFIHGNAIETTPEGKAIRIYHPSVTHPTVEDLLRKNTLHSATLMYKREVFDFLRMNETLNTAEEFEFNLRCLKAGFKIGYCNSSLAFYRRHPLQKVRVVSKEAKDEEREQVRSMYR